MADAKTDNTRQLDARNLQVSLPRPNIVRIEVLDGTARDRYLKSQTSSGSGTNIYSTTNELRKTTIGEVYKGNRAKEKVFYGFLSPTADNSFNLGATWDTSSLGGDIGGAIKKVVGAAGLVGEGLTAAYNIGSGINDFATKAMGLNSTATGASTMKDFKSVELSDFKVSCVWYIPEQEKLATHSLKLLYRMLYPKQIAQDNIGKLVGNITTNAISTALPTVQNLASDFAHNVGQEKLSNIIGSSKPTNADDNNPPNKLIELTGDVVGAAASVLTGINNLFGANVTINPLPVRVCVGQHIDIEPLVITSIETKFSRETFVS